MVKEDCQVQDNLSSSCQCCSVVRVDSWFGLTQLCSQELGQEGEQAEEEDPNVQDNLSSSFQCVLFFMLSAVVGSEVYQPNCVHEVKS